jgi:hypothetical protein
MSQLLEALIIEKISEIKGDVRETHAARLSQNRGSLRCRYKHISVVYG